MNAKPPARSRRSPTGTGDSRLPEGAIRDLNVGGAISDYDRQQILIQLGTTLPAQSNTNAQSVPSLLRYGTWLITPLAQV